MMASGGGILARCDVVNEAGESAYFALTCGAARLEPVTDESLEDADR